MPDRPSPKTSMCGWASTSRPSGALVDAEEDVALGDLGAHGVLAGNASSVTFDGQQRGSAPRPGANAPGDLVDQVVDAVAERVGAAVAVDARQGTEEVQLGRHEATTGRLIGTRAATLRSTSESSGSLRRSSSLEPKTSRIAAR